MQYRVGQGIDIHPYVEGRKLFLGGVEIPHSHGLKGHSDADALLHALTDALLGAAGLGDIGTFFPDSDMKWKDARSLELLSLAWKEVKAAGWELENLDVTVLAETPKIAPHIAEMKRRIADVLGVQTDALGIKASTAERLGFIGRGDGLLASCVALLRRPSQA